MPSAGRALRSRVGEVAGRYRLTAILGSGAMGVVYRAFDPALGRAVALKSLHVEDVHARDRFIREARAMARVSDPNVVQVFDVVRAPRSDRTGTCWLIAMELVDGVTLDRWLQTPRSWTELRDTFMAAGRGLAAAHAAGLVHRDFKPANVIVGRDGRARVTDFGLSLCVEDRLPTLEEAGSSSSSLPIEVTCPGSVVGTPAYMAPEQHRGAPLTPATDQFAFCAALFEALYGARPFDGRSCKELSEQKHRGQRCEARGPRPVPAWLRRVVLRGLEVEPHRRFGSMSELLAALEGPKARLRPLRTAVLLACLGSSLGVAWTADDQSGEAAGASVSLGAEARASAASSDCSG